MSELEIRYVWDWPVRLTHWINVIAIAVLSITGIYIGHPIYTATDTAQYIMGWNRFIHFVFAYLFLVSVIARFIWMFMGNRHASWREFVPWTTRHGRKKMMEMFKYYTFISRKIPYGVGHNALAATAYSGVILLYVVMIVTGFTLYGQFEPGGFWDQAFGWMLPIVGNQWMRFIHHITMWLLIAFSIHHVYSGWLMDIKERNGTMSSIFGGTKFVDPEHLE